MLSQQNRSLYELDPPDRPFSHPEPPNRRPRLPQHRTLVCEQLPKPLPLPTIESVEGPSREGRETYSKVLTHANVLHDLSLMLCM